MQITLWTAEMFTAEETQIYIIPLDQPQAQWWIMRSKLLSTLYWDKGHTHTHTQTEVEPDSKVISMTFSYSFMYENKYTARLCYTKSMYSKSQ